MEVLANPPRAMALTSHSYTLDEDEEFYGAAEQVGTRLIDAWSKGAHICS